MRSLQVEMGMTRRDMLRRAGGVGVAAVAWGWSEPAFAWWTGSQDALAQARAQMGAIPITSVPLAGDLTLLSGPGGNVAVLSGPDGLVAVDTFVQPAWPAFEKILKGLGGPVKVAIDTHWHFDHSDNNARFRAAGATVLAHANTAKRLSERHDVLGMRIEPVPEAGRPSQTFTGSHQLQMNGETIELGYLPPSHTDTDIYVRFPRENVLHLGDTYFNGSYPFIDAGTGGRIGGMIEAAERGLQLSDGSTKIIPGHGPHSDRQALVRYRDMLVTVRDRVQKLKGSGRTVEQVVAEGPTAEYDATWGKGMLTPEMFVRIVYETL